MGAQLERLAVGGWLDSVPQDGCGFRALRAFRVGRTRRRRGTGTARHKAEDISLNTHGGGEAQSRRHPRLTDPVGEDAPLTPHIKSESKSTVSMP